MNNYRLQVDAAPGPGKVSLRWFGASAFRPEGELTLPLAELALRIGVFIKAGGVTLPPGRWADPDRRLVRLWYGANRKREIAVNWPTVTATAKPPTSWTKASVGFSGGNEGSLSFLIGQNACAALPRRVRAAGMRQTSAR